MGPLLRSDLLDGYLDRVCDYDLDEAAAIITTGKEAYRRRDVIGVIPAALLTA